MIKLKLYKNIYIFIFFYLGGCASTRSHTSNVTTDLDRDKINRHVIQGTLFYKENNLKKARAEFKKLLSYLDIDAIIDFKDTSRPLSRQEKVKEYIDKLEPELLSRTGSIQAIYDQGVVLLDHKQYRSSIEYFAKVLLLDPNFKSTIKYIIQANIEIQKLEEIKDEERLRKENESIKREQKKLAKTYYKQALMYYNDNNMENAFIELRKVIKLDPDNKKAHNFYNKLTPIIADMAREYYTNGLSVYSDGDIKQAIELWEKTLILIPEYPEAIKALERAKAKFKK